MYELKKDFTTIMNYFNIPQNEDQYTEFKCKMDNPEKIAGEIVAFANSDGGVLYIGVDDDGSVFGIENSEKVFQTITNICRDRCIPPIIPIIEQYSINNKEILIINIAKNLNSQKPYRTASGRFYIRTGKDKKDATGRELVRIAQASGELHYDESPVLQSDLNDFSLTDFYFFHNKQYSMTVEEHLEQSDLSILKLLSNLRLAYELDQNIHLTVAGILLFSKNPQDFLPQSRISAVSFKGVDEDAKIIDRQEIIGRLPQLINDSKLFLKRNIPSPACEHGFYREDIVLYDFKSLGEAIINAIAHRDYSLSGSQIRLFVFENRVEIRSPGKLVNSVSLENIKLGVHAERNRSIVRFLSQLGYMSAIGTGIPRLIIRLSKNVSGREPEFIIIGEELRILIWAKEYKI